MNSAACRNCGAPGIEQVCPYCGTYQYFNIFHPVRYITQSRVIRKSIIYPGLMFVGLCSFFVIYFGYFKKLSETNLIIISPFWTFIFLFGYFGYGAETFLQTYFFRKYATVREAYFGWLDTRPFWSLLYRTIPIFPLRNPIGFALWGSFVWVLYVRFFFVAIFPAL
jgi:hypothetical protein